jgi:hypothetical protein
MSNQTKELWQTVKDKISSLRRPRNYDQNLEELYDEGDIQGFEESDDLFE